MNPPNSSFEFFQQSSIKRLQDLLNGCIQFNQAPRLNEAMRYSVLNGGKRLRPLLVYATGLSFGASLESLDPAALAVELIHGYSLIHDDLPAMDDDDLRRGKPTCHKAFDEASAILAGDALQAFAFEILSKASSILSAETQLSMLHVLAKAAGATAMVAGQSLDLEAENKILDLNALENIHQLKTGALISACIKLGALASNASKEQMGTLAQLGEHLGLAFQIQDDILDVEATTEIFGKKQGSDQALNKSTYPKILGMEQAKLMLKEQYQMIQEILKLLKLKSDYLPSLVRQFIVRDY